MKRRKISFAIICILVASICMLVPNKSKAALPTSPVYFGVSFIRENSATNLYGINDAGKDIGYSIGDPAANGTNNDDKKSAIVWNILKYPNDKTGTTGTSGNYYCIREGTGFSGIAVGKTVIEKYTESYDFKDKSVLKTVKLLNTIEDNNYYNLLALSDLLYLA